MLRKITPILCLTLMFSCGFSQVFAQALITHTENNELGLKEIVPEELVFIGQNGDQLFFRDAGHIVLYQFDKKLKQTGRHCMAASSLSRMNNFQFPIPIDNRIFYFNYYVQPGESASLLVKSSDGELQTLLQTNLKGADKSRSFAIKRVLTSAAGKYVLLHLDSYNGDVYTERFIACDSKMQIVWDKELPKKFYNGLSFSDPESETKYAIDDMANMSVYGVYKNPAKHSGEINHKVPHVLSFNAALDNLSYQKFEHNGKEILNFTFAYQEDALLLGAVVRKETDNIEKYSIVLARHSITDQHFTVQNEVSLNKELIPEILDEATKEFRRNKFRNMYYELVIRDILVHENKEISVLTEMELNRVDNYAFHANTGISMKVPGEDYKMNIGRMDILAFRFDADHELIFSKRLPKLQQKTLIKQRSFVSVSSDNTVQILFNDDKVGQGRLLSMSLNGAGELKSQTLSRKASCRIYPLLKVESFAGNSRIAQQVNEHQGIFWAERDGEKMLTTVIYP